LVFAALAVAAVALVLSVRRRRTPVQPSAPAAPRSEDEPARESLPDTAEGGEEPEPELVEAWVQFLREHVTQAVNDLNNCLSAIVGSAHGMKDSDLDESQREDLKRIAQEVHSATEVTGSLLNRVSSEAPAIPPPAWNLLKEGPTRAGQILIVEDDDSNRAVMAKLFRKLGHEVITVSNGYEAFEVIQREQLDCIISDLHMPTLGGKTLFEQVENKKPDMASRFIFVTGDYTRPESYEFLQKSGRPVVGKPYELEQLLAAVATVFGAMGVLLDGSVSEKANTPPT
jgi:CheY-like chemotaxis protein